MCAVTREIFSGSIHLAMAENVLLAGIVLRFSAVRTCRVPDF